MGKVEIRIEIDAQVLEQLRAAGVDVESLTAEALERALGRQHAVADEGAEARAAAWATEHAEAIASHNRYVEEHGVFGAQWRRW